MSINNVNIYSSYHFFFKRHVTLIIGTLLFCLCFSGQAKQLSFKKTKLEQAYSFQYQWLDSNETQQSISFTLSNEGLFERFRNFKSYQNKFAQKTIVRRIKKEMRKKSIAGVQIQYQLQNDTFSIKVNGQDKEKVAQAYQELSSVEAEVIEQYLSENYYQPFTNHEQQTGIKVNHANIANDSVSDLKPLKPIILDKAVVRNIRKVTNYVLSFIQSIPYSTLESRLTSSGAGFNPPLKLLWENQGDCDSKMTLTAALLRALMPRIKMVLVFIDNHALIGIDIPTKAGEVTIVHEQVTYVLAEPTGPALIPLGQLAPESELAINQGHYSVQSFYATSTLHEDDDIQWVEE